MTNFEKYKNEILHISEMGACFAIENGKIKSCYLTNCENCIFYEQVTESCEKNKIIWLYEDDGEPSPLENKISESRAKEAIKTLKEFCSQTDCITKKCPIVDWCGKSCQAMLPESWEV